MCRDCRAELLEQPKEFLVDMLGRVAGVNVITIASLALHSPDSLDTLAGVYCEPRHHGNAETNNPLRSKGIAPRFTVRNCITLFSVGNTA